MEQTCEFGLDQWHFCNTGPEGVPKIPIDYHNSPHIGGDSKQQGWYIDWLGVLYDLLMWIAIYYFCKFIYRLCKRGWFHRTCGPCCNRMGERLKMKYYPTEF